MTREQIDKLVAEEFGNINDAPYYSEWVNYVCEPLIHQMQAQKEQWQREAWEAARKEVPPEYFIYSFEDWKGQK